MLEKGLVQVYTGDGKGKTTAALGLALRASGRGLKTIIVQFMKNGDYGETRAVKRIDGITIEQYGLPSFVIKGKEKPEDYAAAERGLARALQIMENRECDILILDELNITLHFGLLKIEQVIEAIGKKPEQMEIVITGRCMPREIAERADLITEMKMLRHPYEEGIDAREGIEF